MHSPRGLACSGKALEKARTIGSLRLTVTVRPLAPWRPAGKSRLRERRTGRTAAPRLESPRRGRGTRAAERARRDVVANRRRPTRSLAVASRREEAAG